jgi:hypothetical protein
MTTHDVKQSVELYDLFVENKDSLLDVEWLTDTLTPHCKYRFLGWRGTWLRIIQHPYEFARFLIFMAQNGVRSYIEIGTSTGGSFMAVDSYLRAAVPDFQRSIGYDRSYRLRDFDIYQRRFPTCTFQQRNSRRIRLGSEKFDAAFIDATHLEHAVLRDFGKVRNNCRFVGLHDIVLRKPSTVDMAWELIKRIHPKHWEFIENGIPEDCRCGIGVVEI